jgi:PHS family inorganic phosphate transporter-like MFS transporter
MRCIDGVELIIIIIGTFAQALSGSGHAVSIIGVLIVWRFLVSVARLFSAPPLTALQMGIGIGGDYPLSATISSEFASTHIRGRMMSAVFASQGWGNFGMLIPLMVSQKGNSCFAHLLTVFFFVAAVFVGLMVTIAYKPHILSDPVGQPNHIDAMWRILIGLGCVPGVISLYFRLTIPETPRFTMDIERNVLQAVEDIESVLTGNKFLNDPDAVVQRADAPRATKRDFHSHFGKWENLKVLIGTSYSWFALDVRSPFIILLLSLTDPQIAFYGLGLNSSIILGAIGFGSPITKGNQGIYDNLHNICVGNLILSIAGLIPGYWVSFLFIDSWGRKPIQLMVCTHFALHCAFFLTS